MSDELDFDLTDDQNDDKLKEQKNKERVAKAEAKKKALQFQPTWEQAWNGYENPSTNKWKKGIWELKNTDKDIEILSEVKQAVENDELALQDTFTGEPIPMKKFSKSKAKELYVILERQKRAERLKEIVEKTPSNYHLITTSEKYEEVLVDLEEELETALDSETTGLDVYVDYMVGVSITLPKHDYHVYVPFGHVTGEQQLPRDYVLNKLEPYLMSDTKKFLHNAKFDKHMFIRHGKNIGGKIHDSQVAMQILNENEMSKRLKDLATKYKKQLGIEEDSYTFEQMFGKNASFEKVPLEVATVYACKDTHITYLLGKWQEKFIQAREGLSHIFYEVEMPLLPVVVDMERTGLLVDVTFAKEYATELKGYLLDLENEIRKEFGDINLNSSQQLQKVLYDDWGLEDISGKRKTDKPTLKILSDECEILKTLLKYKDLFKLHSTYISALPEKIKADGRVHGQFNQDKTDTGRFSSKEPNLQNLPSRARKLFIAPENHSMFAIDFSQIEPRVLAHITGDEEFKRVYIEGRDLYSVLASRVFNKTIEECGDGSIYRKMMKTGLLAVMYGTSMFTLSKQLKISIEEAEQFIEDFFEAYPKVKTWIESIWEFVKENEYVETLYGRKRRFPKHREQAERYEVIEKKICTILGTKKVPQDFWDKKKYPQLKYPLKRSFQDVKGSVERVRRQSVNAIIQGSSADIMKKAIINLDVFLKKNDWQMFATVHDEALSEVEDTITHEQIIEMNKTMSECVVLDVPLKTDIEIQKTWGNAFKFDVERRLFFHKDDKTGETLFEETDLKKAFERLEEVS